jgi:hypothetical protein
MWARVFGSLLQKHSFSTDSAVGGRVRRGASEASAVAHVPRQTAAVTQGNILSAATAAEKTVAPMLNGATHHMSVQ